MCSDECQLNDIVEGYDEQRGEVGDPALKINGNVIKERVITRHSASLRQLLKYPGAV